jgi:hypothetical protein
MQSIGVLCVCGYLKLEGNTAFAYEMLWKTDNANAKNITNIRRKHSLIKYAKWVSVRELCYKMKMFFN